MPNDAKLGLVVGVGLVIAFAVVFFRKDLATTRPRADETSRVVVSAESPSGPSPRSQARSIKARPVTRTDENPGQHHTVKEGETLLSLAERYYGNSEKSADIFRANREVLQSPDDVPAGTVLIIPDLNEAVTSEAAAPGS